MKPLSWQRLNLIEKLLAVAAAIATLITLWITLFPRTKNQESPDPSTTTAPTVPIAEYDFEASTQGWLADITECPGAGQAISNEQRKDGENALKWTLPASTRGRCSIDVTVAPTLDMSGSVVVGCWVWIPEGLRSDSSVGPERREFGLWLYDDSFQAAFSSSVPATREMAEWEWVEMEPGKDYTTLDGDLAERPDAFGRLNKVRVWYNSESELQKQEAIFIDSCQIGRPT